MEKTKKVALKLKKKHPRGFMPHGKHEIMPIPFIFELNEEELKLLKTTGPAHWIVEVDKKGVAARTITRKEMSEKDILIKDLKEMKVKLSGNETIEDLEKKMKEVIDK